MEHNCTLKRKRSRPLKNGKGNIASSFFKIILNPTLEEKKMRIPYRFVKRNGSKLVEYPVVDLVDPCGRRWQVRVTRDGDHNVWFDGGGWNDLVDFYSICHGHFLVFQYHGKSKFDFQVFDTSTCNIDYAKPTSSSSTSTSTTPHVQEQDMAEKMVMMDKDKTMDPMKNEQIDHFDEEGHGDDAMKVQKTIKEEGMVVPENVDQLINLDEEEEDGYTEKVQVHDVINFLHQNRLLIPINPTGDIHASEQGFIESYVSKKFVSNRTYSGQDRRMAVRAVETIKPRHPNFLVIIKKIGSPTLLYVPFAFTERYLISKMSGGRISVKIVGDGGRSWSIWMNQVPNGGFTMNATHIVRDLNLKNGDICVFELHSSKVDDGNHDHLLKVSTYSMHMHA